MDVMVAVILGCLLLACALWYLQPAKQQSPETVLRRCRAGLWMVQYELEHLPATRQVCEAMEKCGRLERRIDQEEHRFGIGREGGGP